MKRFWQGFGTAILLVAIAVFVVYPQYADYRSMSQTSVMLNFLRVELQDRIEAKAAQLGTLEGVGGGVSMVPSPGNFLRIVHVEPNGLIVAKGGAKGQTLVLLPSLSQGKVIWRCVGGADHDVPSQCR
jgi:hypothetical protein